MGNYYLLLRRDGRLGGEHACAIEKRRQTNTSIVRLEHSHETSRQEFSKTNQSTYLPIPVLRIRPGLHYFFTFLFLLIRPR